MDSGEKRRRFLIIGGIVVLIIATILAIYFVFFRTPTTIEEEPNPTFGTESGDRENVFQEREEDRTNNTGIFSPVARLRILSEEPVSGAISILSTSEEGSEDKTEFVRYNERQTGHVFDIQLADLDKERVSNTTIPRIYESLWTADGKGVILRYLDDDNETIKTYFASLVRREEELREGETPFSLEGSFLRDNITDIVLSPSRTRVFWLSGSLQETRGVVSDPNGENIQTVFTSPFSEWLPQWVSAGVLTLTTKASGYASGFSYEVPVATGSLSRILGDIPGLTTLTSPDGRYVLYSKGTERDLSLHLFDEETGETTNFFIATLPEKCTWADDVTLYCGVPSEIEPRAYPDSWYQGKTLFVDDIYRIEADTGRASLVYSPLSQDEEIIDIYKPFMSKDGDYLIFNNKHDMSLWAFTIIPPVDNPFGNTVIPEGSGI